MRAIHFRLSNLFTVFIILVFAGALIEASEWPLRASIIVLVLGSAGLALAIAQLVLDLRRPVTVATAKPIYEVPSFDKADSQLLSRDSLEIWAWLIGLVCAIPIVGLPVALTAFVFLYARTYGASWGMSAFLAALVAGFIYGIYVRLMYVYWPPSLLGKFIDWM